MPIGLLVFIVFMIVVLQILQTIGKRAARRDFDPSEDSSGAPEGGEKNRRKISLFSNLQNHGLNQVWMQAAGNYDLTFIRPGEEGIYPGIGGESGELLVRAYIDEGDQDSPPSTVIEVKYKEKHPLDFLLMKDEKGVLEEAMAGKPRLESLVGLLASSRNDFAMTGSDPERLKSFFNPVRKNILEDLLKSGKVLHMDREKIYWSQPGVIREEEILSEMLGLVIAAGSIFREGVEELASPAPGPAAISPAPAEKESIIFAPLSVSKPEKEEKAEAIPETIELEIPEKKEEILPEKEIKKEILPDAPAEETGSPSPLVASPEENPGEEKLALQLLAEELFAVSFPDGALRTKWEEKKGILMEGEGIIRSSYDYRSDFVFGGAPGVKVTIDLGELAGKEGHMKLPYRAVISFPAEEKEFFRISQGKKIHFTGKLLKFETFAREIYLAEGMICTKEEK